MIAKSRLRTALLVIGATLVPGGWVVLAIGFAGHLLARARRKAPIPVITESG